MPDWCNTCANNNSRGCEFISSSSSTSTSSSEKHYGGPISPVGAGFLGAGLAIVVFTALLALGILLGIVSFGKTAGRKRENKGDDPDGLGLRRVASGGGPAASEASDVRDLSSFMFEALIVFEKAASMRKA